MGVWIEIHNTQTWETYQYSHSLRGSVDWNLKIWMVPESKTRHSLRGSVDWNSCKLKIIIKPFNVTPFVGVWIEIVLQSITITCSPSLPSWECGLKLRMDCKRMQSWWCHSLRGSVDWNFKRTFLIDFLFGHSLRGSVDWNSQCVLRIFWIVVTPFVGVWIEIIIYCKNHKVKKGHSLRGSVDWNYRVPDRITEDRVTPFVGVWIEINKSADWQIGKQSLPSWECGLKLNHTKLPYSTTCHSLRGSVDWNSSPPLQHNKGTRHSLRGSVDWNTPSNNIKVVIPRHSLRGSVDWNPTTRTVLYGAVVTPFVGVWIEISFWYKDFDGMASLPSWECGLKFFHPEELVSIKWSLPSWECGLKCFTLAVVFNLSLSLPSWECGLKFQILRLMFVFEIRHSLRGSMD